MPDVGAPKFIKQILLDIHSDDLNMMIEGNFNTPVSSTDRSSSTKTSQ
jgi:hypothetical protein